MRKCVAVPEKNNHISSTRIKAPHLENEPYFVYGEKEIILLLWREDAGFFAPDRYVYESREVFQSILFLLSHVLTGNHRLLIGALREHTETHCSWIKKERPYPALSIRLFLRDQCQRG